MSSLLHRVVVAVLLAVGIGIGGTVSYGQRLPSTAPDSLRTVAFEEALRLFKENNLSLKTAQSDVQAVAGEARQTGAYPNPTVQVTHEPVWGEGGRQSETDLSLSQRIEWSGRSDRIDAIQKRTDAARAQADSERLEQTLEAATTYIDAATAETRLRRLKQVARLFRTADSSMAARERKGDASGYAVRRIRLERARYEQRLAAARLEAQGVRRRLALLILPEEAPAVAARSLPTTMPPAVSEQEALRTALDERPALRQRRAEVAAQQSALQATRQEVWPDPTLTAGYKQQSAGFRGAVLGLDIPLPLFDRNGGATEAESARLQAAKTRQTLVRRRIRNEVRRAHEAYASVRRQSTLLEGELLRGSEDLLDIAQTSYGEGEMSLVELLDAADAYRDARLTTVDLRADLWTRYFELRRAMGRPIALP